MTAVTYFENKYFTRSMNWARRSNKCQGKRRQAMIYEAGSSSRRRALVLGSVELIECGVEKVLPRLAVRVVGLIVRGNYSDSRSGLQNKGVSKPHGKVDRPPPESPGPGKIFAVIGNHSFLALT